MMKITINGHLTYICNEEVEVGDEVVLPPPHWKPPGSLHVGKVTSLTGDYDGECLEVLKVIPQRKEVKQ